MAGPAEPHGSLAPAPAAASVVFGERLPLAETYAGLLATDGVERGLIGPREVPRLWERHLLNCGALADAMPASGTVADIGSGAGLPGLVLAIARPSLAVTLVEPLLRRVTFLDEAVEVLGLSNVEVLRTRAEDLSGRRFDITTSRAVAPLPRLVTWCLPLTAVGGAVVAMKGSTAQDEIDAVSRAAWGRSGAEVPVVESVGVGIVDPAVTVVRLVRLRETRVRLGGRADRGMPGSGTAGRRGGTSARRR